MWLSTLESLPVACRRSVLFLGQFANMITQFVQGTRMPVKLVLGHVLRTALTAGVSVPQSEANDPGDPELGFGRKSVSEPAYLNSN